MDKPVGGGGIINDSIMLGAQHCAMFLGSGLKAVVGVDYTNWWKFADIMTSINLKTSKKIDQSITDARAELQVHWAGVPIFILLKANITCSRKCKI